MQWNQCIELEERVDSAVRDTIATPHAERDPEVLLEALGATADTIRSANRRWHNVLRVQLALCIVGAFSILVELRLHWVGGSLHILENAVLQMWPLILSARAIWHMNFFIDGVPQMLVRHRVFSLVECVERGRCCGQTSH